MNIEKIEKYVKIGIVIAMIFGIVLIIILCLPKKAKITDYECCEISGGAELELTYNEFVNSGYIKVAFYDVYGNVIKTEEKNFIYGKTQTLQFYFSGECEEYEIIEFGGKTRGEWRRGLKIIGWLVILFITVVSGEKIYKKKKLF